MVCLRKHDLEKEQQQMGTGLLPISLLPISKHMFASRLDFPYPSVCYWPGLERKRGLVKKKLKKPHRLAAQALLPTSHPEMNNLGVECHRDVVRPSNGRCDRRSVSAVTQVSGISCFVCLRTVKGSVGWYAHCAKNRFRGASIQSR